MGPARAAAVLAALAATVVPGAGVCSAQPVIRSVVNAASLWPQSLPGGGIAPGSIFLLRGSGLGPAESVKAPEGAAPEELAGVSVRVVRGSRRWVARVLSAGAEEVRAILPPAVTAGNVSVVVRYGRSESRPAPVRITLRGLGLFTLDGSGVGPARAEAVRRGQPVTLAGTGLGRGGKGIDVFVGGRPAEVVQTGPSQSSPGVDEIAFRIPADAPRGCYVPVQVRIAGAIPSNTATLAVEPDADTCGSIDRLDRYFIHGGRAGFVIPFHLAMRYDRGAGGRLIYQSDALAAGFRDAAGGDALGRTLYAPPVGACAVYAAPVTLDDLPDAVSRWLLPPMDKLDAGILRAGPPERGIAVPPPARDAEVYYGVLGSSLPDTLGRVRPLVLKPGAMQVSGAGGRDVGPFSIDVRIPEPVRWVNREATGAMDRGRDLLIQWSLTAPRQVVAIAGVGIDNPGHATAGFLCVANAPDGQFRVPALVLQALPATRRRAGESRAFLFVGTFPFDGERLFPAPGLHGLFAIGAAFDGRTIRIR